MKIRSGRGILFSKARVKYITLYIMSFLHIMPCSIMIYSENRGMPGNTLLGDVFSRTMPDETTHGNLGLQGWP